ncbi:glycosyltransferase [Shouchella patagoniensis]|uniref:glycosyltransferase n=1 Tax=Shouchella patagoniensis TaxID=228576 RepID=UPI002481E936|nr:glycosyltransferase [Shouchella patagoniensis]
MERMTLHLADAFVKRGYVVDIVVMNNKGEHAIEIPKGVRVVDLAKRKVKTALPALISYLREAKPDVVCSAKDYINVIVIIAKKISMYKGKLIVSSRVHLSEQAKRHQSSKKIKKWVARTYRFADEVVGVSMGVAKDIENIANLEKVHIIYNPVVTDELKWQMKDFVEHTFFEEKQSKVFITVGRLHEQKDYPTLIEAFAYVHNRDPKTRLIIVGDGEERKALEQLVFTKGIGAFVDFIGFQSNPYAYIKQADVFVLSSIYEGFGNVIVEALAAGTPVVSTDCPSGPSEILGDGLYGQLVPVGDAKELAKGMEIALLKPMNAKKLTNRAAEYSVIACADKYEKLIKNTPVL